MVFLVVFYIKHSFFTGQVRSLACASLSPSYIRDVMWQFVWLRVSLSSIEKFFLFFSNFFCSIPPPWSSNYFMSFKYFQSEKLKNLIFLTHFSTLQNHLRIYSCHESPPQKSSVIINFATCFYEFLAVYNLSSLSVPGKMKSKRWCDGGVHLCVCRCTLWTILMPSTVSTVPTRPSWRTRWWRGWRSRLPHSVPPWRSTLQSDTEGEQ